MKWWEKEEIEKEDLYNEGDMNGFLEKLIESGEELGKYPDYKDMELEEREYQMLHANLPWHLVEYHEFLKIHGEDSDWHIKTALKIIDKESVSDEDFAKWHEFVKSYNTKCVSPRRQSVDSRAVFGWLKKYGDFERYAKKYKAWSEKDKVDENMMVFDQMLFDFIREGFVPDIKSVSLPKHSFIDAKNKTIRGVVNEDSD